MSFEHYGRLNQLGTFMHKDTNKFALVIGVDLDKQVAYIVEDGKAITLPYSKLNESYYKLDVLLMNSCGFSLATPFIGLSFDRAPLTKEK